MRGLDLIGSTVLVSDGLPTERKNDSIRFSASRFESAIGLPKSAYDVTQRDAIFIRATLWRRGIRDGLVSLLVCMPVRRMVVYCIETAHRIKLFFCSKVFLDPSYTVC